MSITLNGTSGITAPAASLTTPLPEASGGTNAATFLAAEKAGLNASGSAPIYACRAWCTFNGNTAGTNAPTAGGNVTSVTKNSTGNYTINLTTAMVDANYAVQCLTNTTQRVASVPSQTTTSFIIALENYATTSLDASSIAIAVFR